MARTVIDIDEKLLAEAASILGTEKKVATVNAALADVVKRRKREEFFAWLDAGGLPDLTGPVERAGERGDDADQGESKAA
jgi:Arc/MetJ family transcription regulator